MRNILGFISCMNVMKSLLQIFSNQKTFFQCYFSDIIHNVLFQVREGKCG